MPPRFAPKLVTQLTALAALVASSACSGENSCIRQRALPCACSDGRAGAQTCQADGSYGACVCVGSPSAGHPEPELMGAAGDSGNGGQATSAGDTGDSRDTASSSHLSKANGSSAGETRSSQLEPLAGIRHIAAGGWHTCALLEGGAVWCWGSNNDGELGDQTLIDRSEPRLVKHLEARVVHVAAADAATCAALDSGEVKCWGSNWSGQLGDGTTEGKSYPVTAARLSQVTRLVAGPYAFCGLLETGGLKCWGDEDESFYAEPSAGVAMVALGSSHMCLLLADDKVQCAGRSYNGQLGNGQVDETSGRFERNTLETVVGLDDGVLSLAANRNSNCAVTPENKVKCWGSNDNELLGGATTASAAMAPTEVPDLEGVVAVSMGLRHACALDNEGHVHCWGSNVASQLGGSSSNETELPKRVEGLEGAVQIAVGAYHTCALLDSGMAKCWGANSYGQLGDGSFNDQPLPMEVVVP